MEQHLKVSDHSPSIGPEVQRVEHPVLREIVRQVKSPVMPPVTRDPYLEFLERRIEALEQRTWWSMLKDWVKSWF